MESTTFETFTTTNLSHQCVNEECSNVALFTDSSDSTTNKRCCVHVTQDKVWHILSFKNGAFVISPHTYSADLSFSLYRHMNVMMAQAIDSWTVVNREKFAAMSSLSNFQDLVVETTVEWDGGCRSGKEEFLQALGLSYPSVEMSFTVTFTYEGDPDNFDSSEIESAIANYISDVSDIYVEVQ